MRWLLEHRGLFPRFRSRYPLEGLLAMKPWAIVERVQTADGAPTAIPHDMAGKENCAMCHGEGVMGAAKMPANHGEMKNENCTLCHAKAG